jgi:cytochrome c peroxidase
MLFPANRRERRWTKWCDLVLAACFLVSPAFAHAVTLELAVRHCFDGSPVRLDSLAMQTAAGETLAITRWSYLVSGIALEKAEGGWVELKDHYGWLDVGARRSSIVIEDAPPGRYRALRFYLGPDAATNAADPSHWPAGHPLNTNFNGLYWSMQGGYIFMALEGQYRGGTDELRGFSFHLARDAYRPCINLAASLDLTHDAAVVLDFDLASLLNTPGPFSLANDGNTTHSRDGDPVAAALLGRLPGAFRVRQVLSTAPAITLPSSIKPLYLPAKITPYPFSFSRAFPIPDLPRDNPLLSERVALGEKLFHESALSKNGTVSCASCHDAGSAYADRRGRSVGVHGESVARNAMPLENLAWKPSFFWDGRAPSLRAQALMPIQDAIEMGETLDHVTEKLSKSSEYPALFGAAFNNNEITPEKIGLALENYLLTLTSYQSKFDKAMRGAAKLNSDEQRGFELFMTESEPRTGQRGADCFHCHGGPLFSDHQFHNNGLAPDERDPGRYRVTHAESDRNKFVTPSLRNVARTAPYMHDGRFGTLEEVMAHYNSGIHRSDNLDPNLAKHPGNGLQLSETDLKALVAFLKTLSDD